jgi:hypothetical protein
MDSDIEIANYNNRTTPHIIIRGVVLFITV